MKRFAVWVLAIHVPFLAACVNPNPPPGPVQFGDLHGLAVDPTDPTVLYAATHYGLFRGVNGTGWTPIGRAKDHLEALAVHPVDPLRMYAGGHAENQTRNDWSMGIVGSTDGGRTWKELAYKNQAEFHVVTVNLADPNIVWAWAGGQWFETKDGGANWSQFHPRRLPATGVNAIASSVRDPNLVWAATGLGFYKSTNAARTWEVVFPNDPTGKVATTRGDPDLLWVFYVYKGFARSPDGGTTWATVEAPKWEKDDGLNSIALDPTNPNTMWLGSARGAIYKSTDAGATWQQLKAAEYY